MREKQTRPTATELAKRAGCSLRSVYERFKSLDALALASFDYLLQDWARFSATLTTSADRHTRLKTYVRARAQTCETSLSVWREVLRINPSPELQARMDEVRKHTLEGLELAFHPELVSLSKQKRRTLLIVLEAI